MFFHIKSKYHCITFLFALLLPASPKFLPPTLPKHYDHICMYMYEKYINTKCLVHFLLFLCFRADHFTLDNYGLIPGRG